MVSVRPMRLLRGSTRSKRDYPGKLELIQFKHVIVPTLSVQLHSAVDDDEFAPRQMRLRARVLHVRRLTEVLKMSGRPKGQLRRATVQSLGPRRYINVRKLVDFSTSAPQAGERKSFGQFWFFHELNLAPTVEAGDGGVGLLGFGHSQWHRALIAKSMKNARREMLQFLLINYACCSTFSSCTKARTFGAGGHVFLYGGLRRTPFGEFLFQQ